MKTKKANVDMMVTLTITAIIAMITISVVWGLITSQTASTSITDDLFTADNGACVRLTDQCVSGLPTVANTTATVGTGNYSTCPTDNQDKYGLQFLDAEYDAAALNATYTQISCERLIGTTATIVSYVPLLMAVGLLVFVALFVRT